MKDLDNKTDIWSYDYSDLINSFDVTVVVQTHDNSYQGDSFYLLEDNGRYGFLVFGWGSCSGCDELQTCDTYEDVVNLRDRLWDSIFWGTAEEIVAYMNKEAIHWYDYYNTFKQFRAEVKRYA